jgi:hypothetical protein
VREREKKKSMAHVLTLACLSSGLPAACATFQFKIQDDLLNYLKGKWRREWKWTWTRHEKVKDYERFTHLYIN